MKTERYPFEVNYDEMFDSGGNVRQHYQEFDHFLAKTSSKKMHQLQFSANKTQKAMGMTFNVYHDNQGLEKSSISTLFPGSFPIQSGKKSNPDSSSGYRHSTSFFRTSIMSSGYSEMVSCRKI